MKTLFLAWQDPITRSWTVIGRLVHRRAGYEFSYTQGARRATEESRFEPLPSFPELEEVYESTELFPLFANRLPSSSRPEFKQFVRWLNVPEDECDPIALLARSGGRRATDSIEVFPCPEPDEQGSYHIHFFVHGIRHFPSSSAERLSRLETGERLLLVWDFQNPYDGTALALRTNDRYEGDRHLIGFCPRYLGEDLFSVLRECDLEVKVERLNPPPAPLEFRLLCNLTGCWPDDFRPCSSSVFRPINEAALLHTDAR